MLTRHTAWTAVLTLILAASVRVPISATSSTSAVGQRDTVAAAEDRSRLRQDVERRYRVALLQNGVVLIPREPGRGVNAIEVSDGTVSLDGALVTGQELRARLGRDADLVIALSYLEPPVRREMFRDTTSGAPGEHVQPPASAAPTSPGPEIPAVPAEPDVYRWDRAHRSDARIRVGGSVHVAEDEVVNGPVVAVGGAVTIDGAVTDDVVAIGGSVRLGPSAAVRGDVTTIGGTIDRDPDARIRGRMNEIGIGMPAIRIRPLRGWPFGWRGEVFGASFSLLLTVFRMLLIAVIALVALVIVRRPVERIADAAAAQPWKSGLIGLLAQLFVLPVLVLSVVILAVSIIGIPLLVVIPPLIVLALLVAFVLGFAGIAFGIGRWARSSLRLRLSSPFAFLLVGLLAIWIVTLSGRIVSLTGWHVWFVSAALGAAGFFVEYLVWTVGLGAALLTRFGNRRAAAAAPGPVGPATPVDTSHLDQISRDL